MTTTAFRTALADDLEETAHQIAVTNGKSRSRSIEEQRYFAGYSDGLQAAADSVRTFLHEDGDDE